MTANVIGSGSSGNAIIYDKKILVDCGVSFKALQPYLKEIKIVLLTHKHSDHLNLRTLQILQSHRPTLRIACCSWLVEELPNLKNIDVLEIGKMYNYGSLKVSPVKAYHDVPNCGWRIFKDGFKIFHITDTAHLEGITARNYDLYAIEHNYCEEKVEKAIREARAEGKYCHAIGSIQTHLSIQQANKFIEVNAGANSQVLELHKSKHFY
ncbi:MBL fold metallo-hydrolase [Capnocytophaga canimorsus]|uniref:MBL fold metallo-hydrolase n=1 Tax=Capnocytophaga canimorsus TaxID=28188 RepID=UPI0037D7DDA7